MSECSNIIYFILVIGFTEGLLARSMTLVSDSLPYLSCRSKYAASLLRFKRSHRLALLEFMLNSPRNMKSESLVNSPVINYIYYNIVFRRRSKVIDKSAMNFVHKAESLFTMIVDSGRMVFGLACDDLV
jgi:hypothetical protein